MRNTPTGSRSSTCRHSCDMRAPSAASGVYALECAMDELAVALKLDPLELRLRCYSERDQHNGRPYSSKALRECYRQGAEAFGWEQAQPRAARDARRQRARRLGHGDAASGMPSRCRSPCASGSPPTAMPRSPAARRTSAPAPTRSWPRSPPTCWACRWTPSASSSAIRPCRNRRSRAAHGSRPRSSNGIAGDGRGDPRRSCCAWPSRSRARRWPAPTPPMSRSPTAGW